MEFIIYVHYRKLPLVDYSLRLRYVRNLYRFRTRSVLFYYNNFDRSEPLSIIIYNNVSIHYNPELIYIYYDIKVLLKYLPLYLPDLNFIETLFSILKAWIKRY